MAPAGRGRPHPPSAEETSRLIWAAEKADGVAPLSEQGLLALAAPAIEIRWRRADPGVAGDASTAAAAELAGLSVAGSTGELVVDPGHRRAGHGRALLEELLAEGVRQFWAHGDLAGAAALAASAGLQRTRVLRRLRRRLGAAGPGALPEPAWPAGVRVRAFEPGRDEDAWLAVNARAFADHPEQGTWTAADLASRESSAWFDPAGFFLAERDGVLLGFHWTKVHPPGDGDAAAGEVYVVGVDPAAQTGGLGRALTLAGLRHLEAAGLSTVLLYVDDDNPRAVGLYRSLGFADDALDVTYSVDRAGD